MSENGKWVKKRNPTKIFYTCSKCKFGSKYRNAPVIYRYCPNCGVPMFKAPPEPDRIKAFCDEFTKFWQMHPDLTFREAVNLIDMDIKAAGIEDPVHVLDEYFKTHMEERMNNK